MKLPTLNFHGNERHNNMLKLTIASLILLPLFPQQMLTAEELWKPPRKKIIDVSWSSPTPAYIRKNIRTIEKMSPCSGTAIYVKLSAKESGAPKDVSYWGMFGKFKWKYEWFKKTVEDLKNTEFRKFTDNFLYTTVVPGNVDWFSDSDWESVCNNHAIMARVAHETNMKGLLLDFEEYGSKLWDFVPGKGHSYEETSLKARQRGHEFGKAIFREYPNIKMLCIWWLSMIRKYKETPKKMKSLMGAFINGVYDALPPTAIIIDGHEGMGYRAKSQNDYYRMRADFTEVFPLFIDRKNYTKFKMQTQLAAPMYLDAYFGTRQKGWYWHDVLTPEIDQKGALNLFRQNLQRALDISDEYVWLYCEKLSWWKVNYHGAKPEVIEKYAPGITKIINSMYNLLEYAKNYIAEKKPGNMVKNHNFSKGKNEKIPHWWFWQSAKSKGKCELIKNFNKRLLLNVVMLQGITEGSLVQDVEVTPGNRYFIRVKGLQKDKEIKNMTAIAAWKNSAGKWLDHSFSREMPPNKIDKEGFCYSEFVVTAPENSFTLSLQLKVRDQSSEEKAYFTNAEVYEIE